ncbi:hypothetical protein TRVL_04347 [Trypanosoma vivax]|nr:hypothetical protein TRVL_04347 [Trypanosoma vivax]
MTTQLQTVPSRRPACRALASCCPNSTPNVVADSPKRVSEHCPPPCTGPPPRGSFMHRRHFFPPPQFRKSHSDMSREFQVTRTCFLKPRVVFLALPCRCFRPLLASRASLVRVAHCVPARCSPSTAMPRFFRAPHPQHLACGSSRCRPPQQTPLGPCVYTACPPSSVSSFPSSSATLSMRVARCMCATRSMPYPPVSCSAHWRPAMRPNGALSALTRLAPVAAPRGLLCFCAPRQVLPRRTPLLFAACCKAFCLSSRLRSGRRRVASCSPGVPCAQHVHSDDSLLQCLACRPGTPAFARSVPDPSLTSINSGIPNPPRACARTHQAHNRNVYAPAFSIAEVAVPAAALLVGLEEWRSQRLICFVAVKLCFNNPLCLIGVASLLLGGARPVYFPSVSALGLRRPV